MAAKSFSFTSFLIRFVLAVVLVFATYNPSGYSWYHWFMQAPDKLDPMLALSAVLLLIGWVIYLRATMRSLGEIGTLLAVAFFAALTWVMIDYNVLSIENVEALTYVVQVMLAAIMATGMSWSHIRRRMSGQLDVDEVDEH
ncbi:MAG TPA: hypothetical protein ENK49_07355 [Gammaproteobacteria bacterium]|nr:hypothetical protein [Gammaproteobacteria bacterium]